MSDNSQQKELNKYSKTLTQDETQPGAQAMLNTRSLYLNGQWNEFVEYRIQTEQATLYDTIAA